jgi:hypothetical protein
MYGYPEGDWNQAKAESDTTRSRRCSERVRVPPADWDNVKLKLTRTARETLELGMMRHRVAAAFRVILPPWSILVPVALFLAGMLIPGDIAWAGVKFIVEFDWVANDAANNNKVLIQHKNKAFVVYRKNMFAYYDATGVEHLVRLGRQGTNTHVSGEVGTVQISVVGGRIRFYEVYTGRAVLLEISSNSPNSCGVTVTFYKPRIQEFFEVHHGESYIHMLTNEHAENVSCAASETPD